MPKIVKNNILIAIFVFLFWIGIALVEEFIQNDFLRVVFFCSMPLTFIGFLCANWNVFNKIKNSTGRVVFSVLLSLVITALFLFVGITLTVNVKFLLGGHL